MPINGYFIVIIGGYFIVPIVGYFINGYWWLLLVII
jgi:hypothetical protein